VRVKEQTVLTLFLVVLMGALLWTVIARESMAVPFLVGTIIFPFMMLGLSYRRQDVWNSITQALQRFKTLFGIILLMGISIGLWLFSGVVPAMIFYSSSLLFKLNIVLMCFWIPAFFSFIIGTALGTISTFGIALLAIGTSAGIPGPLLLGAIVSGAFIADRLSPIGGLVNLNLSAHGITYGAFFKASFKRVAIAFGIASVVFYLLGTQSPVAFAVDGQKSVFSALNTEFVIHPLLLAVPVMVILFSVFKRPILWILITLSALCSGIALFIQGQTINALMTTILWGYTTTDPVLGTMLKGGGLIPFFEVLMVVACAIILSSLLEMTQSYGRVSEFFLNQVNDRKTLSAQIGLMSIALTTVTCDQTIGIVTPAQLYKKKSEFFGMAPEEQACAIADTGVMVAPLEPWNVNALVITAMTGQTVMDYGIYSVFLILLIGIYFLESIFRGRTFVKV
jgi:NhaC family Na+:H+ antiporter